jgi:zinc protease
VGDPGFFETDLARYRRVTPEAMQRVSREWLRPDARVLLSVVPRGQAELALDGSQQVSVA